MTLVGMLCDVPQRVVPTDTSAGCGRVIDPRRASRPFAETAEEWLTSNPMKRPAWMAPDESIVRVHIIPALGDRNIGQITQRDVRHLVVAWSTKRAPRTVRRMFGVLRTIFLFAIESDVISGSPCRGVRLRPIAPLHRHVVSADELVLFADAPTRVPTDGVPRCPTRAWVG